MRKLVGVLLFLGCGDPRAVFVGNYKGTDVRTYGGGNPVSDAVSMIFTAPDHSDRLQSNGACMLTARVETADTVQFDPVACPSHQGTAISGATATYTDSYSAGTGALTNKTFVIDLSGVEVGTNFSDGHSDVTLHFSDELTLTRQ